jgi:hypothetical protein
MKDVGMTDDGMFGALTICGDSGGSQHHPSNILRLSRTRPTLKSFISVVQ